MEDWEAVRERLQRTLERRLVGKWMEVLPADIRAALERVEELEQDIAARDVDCYRVTRLEARLARCVEALELRRVNPKPRMTVREVCEEALAAAKGE